MKILKKQILKNHKAKIYIIPDDNDINMQIYLQVLENITMQSDLEFRRCNFTKDFFLYTRFTRFLILTFIIYMKT